MNKLSDPRSATTFDPVVFERLLARYEALPETDAEAKWLTLEAAHVVGQSRFTPHWRTHVAMLQLALATKNGPEFAGQLLRLALVPLGHLLKRLPLGNPGRANVSAFEPMPVRADIAELIAATRLTS